MMKNKKIFYPVWQSFLMSMGDEVTCLSKINKIICYSQSSTAIVSKDLIERQLITKSMGRSKRVKELSLTKTGKEVRDNLLKIKEMIGDNNG